MDESKSRPIPAKRLFKSRSPPVDVPCDLCQGIKLSAAKSCLTCCKSYCESHLTPHLKDLSLTKHSLTDPGTFISVHHCKEHNKPLEKFCRTDKTPVCMKCMEREHRHHVVVPLEMESKSIRVREILLYFTMNFHSNEQFLMHLCSSFIFTVADL